MELTAKSRTTICTNSSRDSVQSNICRRLATQAGSRLHSRTNSLLSAASWPRRLVSSIVLPQQFYIQPFDFSDFSSNSLRTTAPSQEFYKAVNEIVASGSNQLKGRYGFATTLHFKHLTTNDYRQKLNMPLRHANDEKEIVALICKKLSESKGYVKDEEIREFSVKILDECVFHIWINWPSSNLLIPRLLTYLAALPKPFYRPPKTCSWPHLPVTFRKTAADIPTN